MPGVVTLFSLLSMAFGIAGWRRSRWISDVGSYQASSSSVKVAPLLVPMKEGAIIGLGGTF
jgi:hypothetical protein